MAGETSRFYAFLVLRSLYPRVYSDPIRKLNFIIVITITQEPIGVSAPTGRHTRGPIASKTSPNVS